MTRPSQLGRTLGTVGRTLGWILLICLAALTIVMMLTAVQARRDETRPVKAALVFTPLDSGDTPSDTLRALLDRALGLRAGGYTDQIIVTGGAATGDTPLATDVRRYLRDRGYAEEAILPDELRATPLDQARSAAILARQKGIDSVLVVAPPSEMLTLLKMTRDLGLESYGAPIGDGTAAADLLRGTMEYLRYILLRR